MGVDGRHIELARDVGDNVKFADEVSTFFRALWAAHAGGAPACHEDLADRRDERLHVLRGPSSLDLTAAGISDVVWATGFGASVDFLPRGALDARMRPLLPGLHVIGAPWLTHRASSTLYGLPTDARTVGQALATARAAA